MEVIEAILALLGLGGLSLTLVWLLFAVFNLLWAILSAVLATRRGRNAWNWFFLTCFYGIFGLLFLACSKTINHRLLLGWGLLFLVRSGMTMNCLVRFWYILTGSNK